MEETFRHGTISLLMQGQPLMPAPLSTELMSSHKSRPTGTNRKSALPSLLRWTKTAWQLWGEARQADGKRLRCDTGTIFRSLCRLRLGARKEQIDNSSTRAGPVKLLGFDVIAGSYDSLSYLFRDVILSGDYDPGPLPKAKPTIVDIGANIGVSILYFKHLFPMSTIYAFEPNPDSFLLLQQNVTRNNLEDVHLFNVALGRERGIAPMYTSGATGDMQASLQRQRGGTTSIEVEVQRLSDTLARIGEVDFIKMDCEGAEVSILEDLKESHALRHIPRMVIEYHHMIGNESGRLGQFLLTLEEAGLEYSVASSSLPFARCPAFQDIILRAYRTHAGDFGR
jgi:FkbM family methyltransferase